MLIEDLKKTDGIGWDKMQNLDDDKGTEPYEIKSLEDFERKWINESDIEKVRYALVRWRLYWCAKIDEGLFCKNGAFANPDKRDPVWDFCLSGEKYNLKSTRLPSGFDVPVTYNEKGDLIVWFYRHQSERKVMWENRLFLLHLKDDDRLNFKKKYDIIRDYTLYGNPTEKEIIGRPITTNIDGHRVTSDIIIV